MNKSIKAIIMTLLIFTAITVGYYEQSDKKSDVKQPKTYSTETTNMLAMSDQIMFDSTASFRWSYINAEEAGKNLPFQFKMPDVTLTGEPTAFYVTKNDNYHDRLLWVHYANGVNGITLSAILDPAQPDFAGHVDKLRAEITAGISHADKLPSLMDIDGIPAFTIEPGYNDIMGDNIPRGGVVEWWNDGVTYSVFGTRGPEGTSVAELMAIARSLNNSKEVILPGINVSPGYIEAQTDSQLTEVGKLILHQDQIKIMEIYKESTEQTSVTISDSSKISTLIVKVKEIPINKLSEREEANFLPERLQKYPFFNVSFYIDDTHQSLEGQFLIWPDGYICIVEVNSMIGNQRTISYLSASKYPEIYDWLNKNL